VNDSSPLYAAFIVVLQVGFLFLAALLVRLVIKAIKRGK
jgi:hypothetical protein